MSQKCNFQRAPGRQTPEAWYAHGGAEAWSSDDGGAQAWSADDGGAKAWSADGGAVEWTQSKTGNLGHQQVC